MDKKELNCKYADVDKDSLVNMKEEFYYTKAKTSLTVLDIMRFLDDSQTIAIFDSDCYDLRRAVYYGIAQNTPHRLIDLRVSHFYSDYSYNHRINGSFIGIRLVNENI